MKPLTLTDFQDQTQAYDQLVLQSPDTDHFCSSSYWVLPAATALMPGRAPWIWTGESGTVAMMRGQHPDGWNYIEPLEAMWTLCNPLIGPDPVAIADDFVELARRFELEWDLMLLGGIVADSPLFRRLVQLMAPRYQLRLGRGMQRHVANIGDGLDAFIATRPRKFRQNLRRAWRSAQDMGLTFEHADDPAQDPAAFYRRVQDIENRSWKGIEEAGINVGRMKDFYDHMLHRMLPEGALRASFIQHEGKDVAYIFGGVLGETFRGLQFSYDDSYKKASLGNVAQRMMIDRLSTEGIKHYDLGSDIEYKRRWGNGGLKTVTLVVFR